MPFQEFRGTVLDEPVTLPSGVWNRQKPEVMETLRAAFEQENMVGSLAAGGTPVWLKNLFNFHQPEANLYELIPEEFREPEVIGAYGSAMNAADVETITRNIRREQRNRETLQQSGVYGYLSVVAMGLIDPLQIPFYLIPEVRGVGWLRGARRLGAFGAATAAVQELGLQATQATRTWGESIQAVGGAAILSGILGGALGYVPAEKLQAMERVAELDVNIGNRYTRQALRRDLQEFYQFTPEQADAAILYLDATHAHNYARLFEKTSDDFYHDFFAGFVRTDLNELRNSPEEFIQRVEKIFDRRIRNYGFLEKGNLPTAAKGATLWLQDGKAVMMALDKPDFSTLVHELGHIWRRSPLISEAELKTLEDWAGVTDGIWTVAAEEKVAKAVEHIFTEWRIPSWLPDSLRGILGKFCHWIMDVYRSVEGTPLKEKLSPEVRSILEKHWLGSENAQLGTTLPIGRGSVPDIWQPAGPPAIQDQAIQREFYRQSEYWKSLSTAPEILPELKNKKGTFLGWVMENPIGTGAALADYMARSGKIKAGGGSAPDVGKWLREWGLPPSILSKGESISGLDEAAEQFQNRYHLFDENQNLTDQFMEWLTDPEKRYTAIEDWRIEYENRRLEQQGFKEEYDRLYNPVKSRTGEIKRRLSAEELELYRRASQEAAGAEAGQAEVNDALWEIVNEELGEFLELELPGRYDREGITIRVTDDVLSAENEKYYDVLKNGEHAASAKDFVSAMQAADELIKPAEWVESGKPIPVYRGYNPEYKIMDVKSGEIIWTTLSEKNAVKYAGRAGDKGKIESLIGLPQKVFDATNPYDIEAIRPGLENWFRGYLGNAGTDLSYLFPDLPRGATINEVLAWMKRQGWEHETGTPQMITHVLERPEIVQVMRAAGYDALLVRELEGTNLGFFSPTALKTVEEYENGLAAELGKVKSAEDWSAAKTAVEHMAGQSSVDYEKALAEWQAKIQKGIESGEYKEKWPVVGSKFDPQTMDAVNWQDVRGGSIVREVVSPGLEDKTGLLLRRHRVRVDTEPGILFQTDPLAKTEDLVFREIEKTPEEIQRLDVPGIPKFIFKWMANIAPGLIPWVAKTPTVARDVAEMLVKTPEYIAKNLQGIKTKECVEGISGRLIRGYKARLMRTFEENFGKMQARLAGDAVREQDPGMLYILRQKIWRYRDYVNYGQDVTQAWIALARKEMTQGFEPEVVSAAKDISVMMQEIGWEANKLGLMPKDLSEELAKGLIHFPHVWLSESIRKYRLKFADLLREDVMKQVEGEWDEGKFQQTVELMMRNPTSSIARDLSRATDVEELKNWKSGNLYERMLKYVDPRKYIGVEVIGSDGKPAKIDFIESDARRLFERYSRHVVPDIVLTKQFGDITLKDTLLQVWAEYMEKIQFMPHNQSTQEIITERNKVLQTLVGLRDRIRGLGGESAGNPEGFWARASNAIYTANTFLYLGGSMLSSLPDFARPLYHWGLEPYARTIQTYLSYMGTPEMKQWIREAADVWGSAVDYWTHSRIGEWASLQDERYGYSGFERGIRFMADHFGVLSGLEQLTAWQKQLTGLLVSHETVQAGKDLLAGKALRPGWLENFAVMGLDAGDLRAIASEPAIEQHGDLFLMRTPMWRDQELANRFCSAMTKEIDSIILTPGVGDRPFLVDTVWGRHLLQFKSFAMSAMRSQVFNSLQQADKRIMLGILASTFAGASVYGIKQIIKGEPITDDPKELLLEGIDRGGALGYVMDINAAIERLSGGQVGIHPMLGIQEGSRYRNRSIADLMLGATAGTLESMSGSAFQGLPHALGAPLGLADITKTDIDNFYRLFPYHTLWYLRGMFEASRNYLKNQLVTPEMEEEE